MTCLVLFLGVRKCDQQSEQSANTAELPEGTQLNWRTLFLFSLLFQCIATAAVLCFVVRCVMLLIAVCPFICIHHLHLAPSQEMLTVQRTVCCSWLKVLWYCYSFWLPSSGPIKYVRHGWGSKNEIKLRFALRHKKAPFQRFSRVSRGHCTVLTNQTAVLKTQAVASPAI